MLFIIPVEDRPSWKRLPVVCLLLILLNVGLYAFLSGHDDDIRQRMEKTYGTAHLAAREWRLYLQYLEATAPAEWVELNQLPVEERVPAATHTLWYDRGFETWLHAQRNGDGSDPVWRDARAAFEQERNSLSAFRYGLTPGDLRPGNLLTHMFMHGSWGHVIGNMLFLALFGFALEARLGGILLLALYACCGIVAGLAHALVERNSMLPLVGASGAIAGLMGMYVGAYGARAREFLVMIGPWVGSIRMPALFVFVLWLGKEMFSGWVENDGVAYYAHAGGLLAGLLLIQPFRRRATTEPEECVSAAPTPQAVSDHLRGLVEVGQFEKAIGLCEMRLEQDHGNETLWNFYLETSAKAGEKALMRAASRLLATLNHATPDYARVARCMDRLHALRADLSRLPPPHRLLWCELLLNTRQIEAASTVLDGLLAGNWRHPRLERVAMSVAGQLPDAARAAAIRNRVQSGRSPIGQ